MQTQAKSKTDAILKNIEQLGRIELVDMAIAMPLESEIVPAIARSSKVLKTTLDIFLPEESFMSEKVRKLL
jgi:hypothetical protein